MKPSLKLYRIEKGLTQRQVADLIGVSQGFYQCIELGARIGKVGLWEKLSAIFGVPIQELRTPVEEKLTKKR